MNTRNYEVIGNGVYSLAEAERLTMVSRHRIQRWAQGYSYFYKGQERRSGPIIASRNQLNDSELVLDFADILEVRFLNVFREHGVGWKSIRLAAQRAKELLGLHHPFSSRRFMTDGQTIMVEIVPETGDRVLLDLVKSQYVFKTVMAPSLYAGFEFGHQDEPIRWWPLGRKRRVVIDPQRAFGAPITVTSGIPTQIIAAAYQTEKSYSFVARCYEVDIREVKDAVHFEQQLAA